ncbi:MAG: ABC transporter ATP-binding protein [Ruminococcus sp.]|nr:ABC transporter ATP-binding protein [Oscillospiraceae bacterium]
MAVIEVRDVKKHFKVYFDKGHTFKEKILFRNRNRYEERAVLNGISFSVEKGEAIGLVGHNGCGKSTLLKLMTKIIYPDSGSIKIQGRISSLLELGAGFHPDMTGRENIYTNASIFGLTKKEIESRIDEIIEFSELEQFIDNPVRTYSSGMYTRLAFSVAINVDADVLLIDEILAVGDAAFQAKCFEKLLDIKSRGTTIVIVSHSLAQVEKICERSIWIDGGKIRMEGAPNEVHPEYLEYMGMKRRAINHSAAQNNTAGNGGDKSEEQPKEFIAEITKAELTGENGNDSGKFRTGEKVSLKIHYKADPSKLNGVLIGLMFYRNDKLQCYGTNTQRERLTNFTLKDEGTITCDIDRLNLVAGSYWIDIAIRDNDMFAYDYKTAAVRFTVYNSVAEVGVAKLDHKWNFD